MAWLWVWRYNRFTLLEMKQEGPHVEQAEKSRNPLILVVDDEWLNRELMESLLTMFGYGVVLASNGEKALEIAPVRQPDLILLDVRMPDMTGYEVCRKLRDDDATRQTPVVITTALEITPEERRHAEESGATDIINRMMSTDALLAYIAGVLPAA